MREGSIVMAGLRSLKFEVVTRRLAKSKVARSLGKASVNAVVGSDPNVFLRSLI